MSFKNVLSRLPWIAPLVSGVVLVFAYQPFSIPLFPFLGLVPLFWFFGTPRSAREVLVGASVFSVPHYAGNLYWLFLVAKFTPAGAVAAIVTLVLHYLSFFVFPVGMNVLNHKTKVPVVLTAPLLWTLTEHVRAQGALAFPWVTLGYSLSGWPFLAQHADIIGVYGLSWWLALVNALILTLLTRQAKVSARLAWGAVLVAVLVLPPIYNNLRAQQIDQRLSSAPTLEVTVVQPNIPQRLKWDRAARDANLARLNRLIVEAERTGPDLVIGPEACLPMIASADDARLPDEIPSGRCPVLLGVIRGVGDPIEVRADGRRFWRYREHFNSAVLAGPDRERLGAYDKHHLVPISEQIPYKRVLGFILPFMREQFGRFVPPPELELLTLAGFDSPIHFGVLICYESLFTELVREMAAQDARLFVLLTNDAWFGRSSMPSQHLGQSVLRAIELRRSVVVAANTGISALVNPLGRARQAPVFQEALLSGEVPLLTERTFYARWGDLVVYGCYAVAVLLFISAWRAHRERGGV